jgi:hypothetical protein
MVDLPLMVALLPLGQQGNEAALQIGGGTLPTGMEAWPPRPRPAKAGQETRSDMTQAMPAMMPPHAKVVAAQALGSSSGRYVRRKVSSFSGTGEPSHIA